MRTDGDYISREAANEACREAVIPAEPCNNLSKPCKEGE